jgi:hypothetical protein
MKPVAGIPIRPIDAAARDGEPCLVSDGMNFATARWDGERFRFPSGARVPFVVVGYYRPAVARPVAASLQDLEAGDA